MCGTEIDLMEFGLDSKRYHVYISEDGNHIIARGRLNRTWDARWNTKACFLSSNWLFKSDFPLHNHVDIPMSSQSRALYVSQRDRGLVRSRCIFISDSGSEGVEINFDGCLLMSQGRLRHRYSVYLFSKVGAFNIALLDMCECV